MSACYLVFVFMCVCLSVSVLLVNICRLHFTIAELAAHYYCLVCFIQKHGKTNQAQCCIEHEELLCIEPT